MVSPEYCLDEKCSLLCAGVQCGCQDKVDKVFFFLHCSGLDNAAFLLTLPCHFGRSAICYSCQCMTSTISMRVHHHHHHHHHHQTKVKCSLFFIVFYSLRDSGTFSFLRFFACLSIIKFCCLLKSQFSTVMNITRISRRCVFIPYKDGFSCPFLSYFVSLPLSFLSVFS